MSESGGRRKLKKIINFKFEVFGMFSGLVHFKIDYYRKTSQQISKINRFTVVFQEYLHPETSILHRLPRFILGHAWIKLVRRPIPPEFSILYSYG